jgi:hypothetical protein
MAFAFPPPVKLKTRPPHVHRFGVVINGDRETIGDSGIGYFPHGVASLVRTDGSTVRINGSILVQTNLIDPSGRMTCGSLPRFASRSARPNGQVSRLSISSPYKKDMPCPSP